MCKIQPEESHNTAKPMHCVGWFWQTWYLALILSRPWGVWWCATSLHDSPPICFPSERWFSIILSTNTVNILLVPLDPVLSSTHSKYCTLCSNANSSTSSFSTSFSSWADVVPTSKITNLCGAFYKNRWRKKLCKPLTIHTKPRQYTEAPTNTGIY